MKENDTLRRFLFENVAIRGQLVHMDATFKALLANGDYPSVVRDQLGQFLAASALLSSNIKFEGKLIMQVQGSGPISLMVMEASSDRTFRGLAQWRDVPEQGDLASLFGDARLVITIEHSGRQYQGIVALEGDRISNALEAYLHQSEQLDTRLWLATDAAQATGLLLQRLPGEKDEDAEAWNRVEHLAATITADELLGLSAEEVLHRLFHEEDVRLMEREPLSFRCSCSRERVEQVLISLGAEEIRSILEDEGEVSVDCEYCNHKYVFDAVDAEALFAVDVSPQVPPTRH